jgi:hypothetical protein
MMTTSTQFVAPNDRPAPAETPKAADTTLAVNGKSMVANDRDRQAPNGEQRRQIMCGFWPASIARHPA